MQEDGENGQWIFDTAGLPVLRALRRVELSNVGLIRVHPREMIPRELPNSFLMRHPLSWRLITISITCGCFWTQEQMPLFFIVLAGVLSEAPTGNGRYRDGVIGMDALWSGFRLDFDAMRMEIQQVPFDTLKPQRQEPRLALSRFGAVSTGRIVAHSYRGPATAVRWIAFSELSEGSQPAIESCILFSFELNLPEGEGPASGSRLAPKEGHWRFLCLVPGFCCSRSTFVRSCYGQRSPV